MASVSVDNNEPLERALRRFNKAVQADGILTEARRREHWRGLTIALGSIWGRPTWGTWWEWDGRLTSMLILLFLYIGYGALASALADRPSGPRIASIYGLVGAINLPIIHYSVIWWNTLHQGQSIGLTSTSIDSSLLWPLPIAMLGFTLLFAAIVLMRMRALLAEARVEARLRRLASV